MSLIQKERDAAICRIVKKGATYEEAAKLYKISRQRVHQIYRSRYPKVINTVLDKGLTK